MFIKFIYQWNPFNIYGTKVEVEDLICNPLQPTETLAQDIHGHCRRIKIPTFYSNGWKKIVFWLQIRLNRRGHLEAIDNLISLFYQKIFKFPPKDIRKLREINWQINQLRFLKNDYGFAHFREKNSSFIDIRLQEIERCAYSIFTYYYKEQIVRQEEERKKAFILFQKWIKQIIKDLNLSHNFSLIKLRYLIIAPTAILRFLIRERIWDLDVRLQIIHHLFQKINKMEKIHKGKFTIPYIKHYLNRIRSRLKLEVCKIAIELEILIESLIVNYRLTPFKAESKMLLDLIRIDPLEVRKRKACAYINRNNLKKKIKKLNQVFI